MSHMILELALWMLLAFFVGCLLGWLARRLFGAQPRVATVPAAVAAALKAAAHPEVRTVPEPRTPARPPAAPEPMPAARPERPKGIPAARGGKPDNLQRISGVGPKNETTLHSLGFYHFDQIAAWTRDQVDWVDDHLKFNGRIVREEWISQARLLAEGKEEEFSTKYGSGGLKDKLGETRPGTRTRRE